VPETLLHILIIQSAGQLPGVLKVIATNEQFINSSPDKNIFRVLGYHEITIGGKTGDIKPILTYIMTDNNR